MSDKQLSRVAGCPRLPLPIFKAAAEQYFVGKDPSRSEQQNGKKSKVKLLRELSTNDPAVRSWLIKFAKEYKAEQTRKIAAEQGLTINADGRPVTDIDRMVALLEAGQRLEDHFTAEELGSPAPPDPAHDKLWEQYQRYKATGSISEPVQHGCNYCGFRNGPATREINGAQFCNEHDGKPRPGQLPALPEPQSPAAYGKSDPNENPLEAILANPKDPLFGRALELQAIRQAQIDGAASSARYRPGTPMVGPTEPLK